MKLPTAAESINPLAFLHNNKVLNENGSLIEFKDHRYLIEPYADMAEEQVAIKAAQVGWSTLAINKSLWVSRYLRANIIYTLPSKSVVKDFVTPKVDPIIISNKVYQNMVGRTDSIALKSIGDRFVYFRGSFEESSAISISAHILINDELDRSNQKVLRTYQSRLDDAKRERPDLGFIWQFSNPSIPGFGVDDKWQKSDQKHWFVKCLRCKYDWYLKFPDNINFKTKQYICAKCHKTLTDDDRRGGRWVKKRTSDISGYWVSQMMVPWHSASKIIKDSEGDKATFYNFTLGLPYVSSDTSVSRKTITDCLAPGTNPMTDVAMGVDNGVMKTVVIGNAYGIFKIYETENWEDVKNDILRYNAYCVIDALPYPRTPIKLAQEIKRKVFVHYFDTSEKKKIDIIEWGEDKNRHVVKSERTKIIDMVVGEFKDKDIIFNLTLTDLELYISDWGQVYRSIERNPQGIDKAKWLTIDGRRDHYCFATILWRIAMEKTSVSGGIVRPEQKKEKTYPTVSPDMTVPAVDLEELKKRTNKTKNWRTR